METTIITTVRCKVKGGERDIVIANEDASLYPDDLVTAHTLTHEPYTRPLKFVVGSALGQIGMLPGQCDADTIELARCELIAEKTGVVPAPASLPDNVLLEFGRRLQRGGVFVTMADMEALKVKPSATTLST